ncbi:MAG: tRNA-intron lyase [Candidatus Hecatellaceae archaeon]
MVAEDRKEKAKPPKAKFTRGKVILDLKDNPQAEALTARGYGEKTGGKRRFELAPWEALHLLSEKAIEVVDEATGETLSFNRLLTLLSSRDETLWSKYLVFRDLRSRGYMVKPGFSRELPFRVYERGAYGKEPSKFLVLTLREGEPIPLRKIEKALQTAKNAKKEVILGLVERRGEVVYYSLSQFA